MILLQKYFAAANTNRGFVGWFDNIFNPRYLERTYIIKGGSGTGKSTLMKKIAKRAEACSYECEYFYCSSDPESLDGIIVHKKDGGSFAMLDGTAPHTVDPKYPGAADEIINLGEYWCADLLRAQRDEIVALCDKKSRFYATAYSDFSAAGTLLGYIKNEVQSALMKDKLDAASMRLLTKRMHECRIKKGKGIRRIRGLSALSCRGEVTFDSFSDVKVVLSAVDVWGSVTFLFDSLIECADKLGLSYDRAPMPLIPELTEAIRFPELSMSVVSEPCRTDMRLINMSRFVDREKLAMCDRSRIRLMKKAVAELKESGLSKLTAAKECHDSVERIYIGAMDFTRLEAAGERIIERVFM